MLAPTVDVQDLTTRERIRYHEQRSRWHAKMAQLFVKRLSFEDGRSLPKETDTDDKLTNMPSEQLTPKQVRNILAEEEGG